MKIDHENMRIMRKILEADSVINQKKIEEAYTNHKKYKKIAKRAIKQGFDIEKMAVQKKKHFGHIEGKTSSQFFPPITGGQHKRSRSTLHENSVGLNSKRLSKNSPLASSQNIDELN